ncbi:MAG: hypothetical protein JO022_10775, partial [Acidobacteriaceae bacterium]|nr:hypothetical protein [Acidobacteriaceae bacterium]
MTPPPADVRECRPSAELFEMLQQSAAERPQLALACASLLTNEAQRDYVLREAFLAAARQDIDVARAFLPAVMHGPWVTDAGFFPLCRLALSMSQEVPEQSRELLLKTAVRYPSLALREHQQFIDLPFGLEVLDKAAMMAPDEAVGLSAGNSSTSQSLRAALKRSESSEIAVVVRLACDPQLSSQTRQHAAVFVREIASGRMSLSRAAALADSSGFFAAVARLRVVAGPDRAPLYDRVLENYAEVLFRYAQDAGSQMLSSELRELSARDLYLLLTYGRSEEDDLLFGVVFDRLLAPKLRQTPPSR